MFLLFQFTIGNKVGYYESQFKNLTNDQGRESIKNKIREELRKGINKDQLLNPEDKELINKFISKIQKELNE
tara:strand:+ start:1426 stop:1641 length:216 start_codon:yes stop_codon:yes gene_type:complete